MNHGQGLEPEEIELDEPDFLHVPHRVLGRDFVVGALVQRDVVRQRLVGDHDAGGVGGGVSGKALERAGRRHQLPDLGIGIRQLL